jgi:uncharacterized lipoprotein YddW (UPF0748 family)
MKFVTIIFFLLVNVTVHSSAQSYLISGKDPKNFRDYPGGRGEDQLIIYTSDYGEQSTGTNQWGIEATVKDNIVIKIGGNNSPIKSGEFILSGHGSARQFLLQNARVGAKILLTDSAVSISFDAESFRIYSKMRQTELRLKYERIKPQLSEQERELMHSAIDTLNSFKNGPLTDESIMIDSVRYVQGMHLLDELEYRITLSPSIEGRGVWHRPMEKNKEEIAAVVQRFSNAGLNMIFLETIWRGETIYPGFITKQKREFLGFDPLQLFIDEGKKNGIEIHAWIHTFFVGYLGQNEDTSSGPIINAHSNWQLIKRNGDKVSTAESGYLYVNPALPQVQDYIASLYKEVRTLYPDLAGIQMDYIRYPVNVPLEESSDYGDYSRSEYKRVSGIDPMEINPTDYAEQWEQWRLWRENAVTSFVKKIRWENPEVLLSADIFPDIEEARKTKMQNWGDWANKGYVNFLAPMAYSNSTEWVAESVTRMRSIVGEKFPLFVGLAPYLKLTPSMLLQQIEQCRDLKTSGIILFSSSNLSEEQLQLLKIGPFRMKSTPPVLINKK